MPESQITAPDFFTGWPALTLLATVIYGFYGFGIKLSTSRGYAPAFTVVISTATVLALASAVTVHNLASGVAALASPGSLVLHGMGNGFFFAAGSLFAHLSLARVPGSVGFPVSKLNTVFVVLLSLAVFHEVPTPAQWWAIALAMAAVALMAMQGKPSPSPGNGAATGSAPDGSPVPPSNLAVGIAYGVCGAVATALSAIINKSGAMSLDRTAFIAVSYLFSTLSTVVIARVTAPGLLSRGPARGQTALAITMGTLNFVGFMAILKAFSLGPLSVIHPIFSTSMVISIALSTLALKEPLTLRSVIAGLMVMTAVMLTKM